MRIYIHTDMEGLAGVGDGAMLGDKSSDDYRRCQELLSKEVNAAARGFIAGGATDIMVLDSHGGGGNLMSDLLDDGLKYEDNSKQIWWGILDDTWDATCFIGAHAMSGTRGAFLEHTQSGRDWYSYFVNGRETGELGQWAACAGEFGVPMIFVTGDDKACIEARDFFDPVVAVATKTGRSRMSADCLDLDDAYAAVEAGAKEAMSLVGKAKPFTIPKPSVIRWEFCRCSFADDAEGLPAVTRTGPREVEKTVANAGWAILPGLLKCQELEGA